MYCRAKPFKDENHKPRKGHRNTPSFSSTLLDEIYRSIDGAENAGAEEYSGAHVRDKLRSNNGGGRRSTTGDNHEKAAAARLPTRACLVRNNYDNTTAKSEVPHPYNTNPNYNKPPVQMEDDGQHQHLTKSKSRALKVYTNLKKMKQPISPGKKLTNFINSLFANLNSKKFKKHESKQSPKVSSSTPSSSTYSSSASSFSTPSSILVDKNKMMMMRNNPVGVVYDNDGKYYGRPPLPPNALMANKHRNIIRREEGDFSMFEKDDDDDDDDGVSDSSSDLFELDHLVLFGNNNNIFCQELPVYETTYFDKNYALAAAGLF